MAKIGLKYPVVALIEGTHTNGQPIAYGTGMVLGEAVSATSTLNRSNGELYADDGLSDSDNSITGGTISISTSEIKDEYLAKVIGMLLVEDGVYRERGTASPYVGLGYVRSVRAKGKSKYTGLWYHKVQLGLGSETDQTKGENTEFTPDGLEGKIMGAVIDDSGEQSYRDRKTFETVAEAMAWIGKKANIQPAVMVEQANESKKAEGTVE